MSRGGIGKSKKQPPAPAPKTRRREARRREPRSRVRGDAPPRPGLAAALGGMMLGLSAFVVYAGLVLVSEDEPGGQSTLALGLATMPLGFATVAMLSRRQPVILQTLYAFPTAVGVTVVTLTVFGLMGGGAYFAAVTLGIGAGALLTLAQPETASLRSRALAVVAVSAAAALLEIVGLAIVSVAGPFGVVAALNYADKRAEANLAAAD